MSNFLRELAAQLTRIFIPIIIIISVVSNSLNITLLTRPALIHHACSLYFIALAITNLFYSSLLLIFNLLADGYHLDPSRYLSVLCKITSYLLNLCPTLSVYFIVLASIDRYFASSISVRKRSWSNPHVARWSIGILVFILMIFFIGILVVFDISYNGEYLCTIRSDILFNRIFIILHLFVYAIVAPVSMVFFGFLTIYNTKQVRFLPVRISRYRRTEGQLSRMLLLQVGTHIFLTLPFCIIFSMLVFPVQIRFHENFAFAFVICKIPFYFTVTTSFFLYVLSARVYRDELIRLWKKLVQLCHNIQLITNRRTIIHLHEPTLVLELQNNSPNT